jgi:hypothetical protein
MEAAGFSFKIIYIKYMGRLEGYYWIKYKGDWEPAKWDATKGWWTLFYEPTFLYERELEEVNEERILPPQN